MAVAQTDQRAREPSPTGTRSPPSCERIDCTPPTPLATSTDRNRRRGDVGHRLRRGRDTRSRLAEHHEGLVPAAAFPDGRPRSAADRSSRRSSSRGTPTSRQPPGARGGDARPCTSWRRRRAMLRMVVDACHLRRRSRARRSGWCRADIDDLNRLYQLGFRTGFPISVLSDGIYFGVRVRGRLVSAAGTHVVNPREGMGVVGNVMTHTDFRGHDFAKMVTSRGDRRAAATASPTSRSTSTPTTPRRSRPTPASGTVCTAISCERLGRRRVRGAGGSCDQYERRYD